MECQREQNLVIMLFYYSGLELHTSIMMELNNSNYGAPYQTWGSKMIYIAQKWLWIFIIGIMELH